MDVLSDSVSSEVVNYQVQTRRKQQSRQFECGDVITNPKDYVFLLTMTVNQLPMVMRLTTKSIRMGDGAYMIPYMILMIIFGLPVFYMEIFLGQYSRRSQLSLWKISPISYGVFTYIHIIAFAFSIAVGVKGGQVFWYIYQGITEYDNEFPWNVCPEETSNIICYQKSSVNLTKECKNENYSIVCPGDRVIQLSETMYYLKGYIGDESVSVLRWSGLIALAVFYLLVLLFLMRKTFYYRLSFWTLVYLVLFMVIVILQVMSFPGAKENMNGFLKIDRAYVSDHKVWFKVLSDVQGSLCLTSPSVFAYSTRVYFKLRPVYHALIVTFITLFLTFIITMTSYSIMGALATEMNVNLETVVVESHGIIYSIYLHFLAKLMLKDMYTFLFLVIVALASFTNQVLLMAGLVKSVVLAMNLESYRTILAAAYCLISFLLSIIFFSYLGRSLQIIYNIRILFFGGLMSILLESMIVFWMYGTSRLATDIAFMCGSKPSRFWTFTWKIAPCIVLVAFIHSSFNLHYTLEAYPVVYLRIIDGLTLLLLLTVPLLAIRKMIKFAKQHNLSGLFEPTFDWGPPNKTLRKARKLFRPHREIPSQPLTRFNVDSTNWALVKADIKHNQLHAEGETDDKKKSERRSLFY